MSIIEKKEYFLQYRLLDKRIQRNTDELGLWRKRREDIEKMIAYTPSLEDELIQTCSRIVQIEISINREIDALIHLKHRIEAYIQSVPSGIYRFVLECRYIGQKTWEEIGDIMHYDWRHAHRIHKRAMELIEISKDERDFTGR